MLCAHAVCACRATTCAGHASPWLLLLLLLLRLRLAAAAAVG